MCENFVLTIFSNSVFLLVLYIEKHA